VELNSWSFYTSPPGTWEASFFN